jgi:hypothetical protein
MGILGSLLVDQLDQGVSVVLEIMLTQGCKQRLHLLIHTLRTCK